MATIRHQCPHCVTSDIALIVVACIQVNQHHGFVHLSCPRCLRPSGAEIRVDGQSALNNFSHMSSFGGDPTFIGWRIEAFWPELPKAKAPEYLPPEVERVFLQAERNLPVAGNEDAAGTMYRKALDVGLKTIDDSLSGTLGQKIKALATAGKLTFEIAEWSDHVRDLGNEAAHESAQPARQDLEDLRSFTEMVLRYLFTLPNMVRKRRGEKLPWEEEKPSTAVAA